GLAYLSLRGSREARANEHQLLSLFGVALIGAGIAVLDSKDPFPGAWALLPTLGTACLVYSKDSWINRYALASRPLVWIGLISYPLYLWHW
ncbi:MAG: acyltransferase, partial [Burkholderiales bacterium]|nr:acyltransferase [Burkholderiales bacterium]